MIRQVCECDECGKIKGDANHWMIGSNVYASRNTKMYGLAKMPSDSSEFKDPLYQQFCGQQCALKYQAKQMGIA